MLIPNFSAIPNLFTFSAPISISIIAVYTSVSLQSCLRDRFPHDAICILISSCHGKTSADDTNIDNTITFLLTILWYKVRY